MLFPGVSVDDIRANTGFAVKTAEKVETIEPPTQAELQVLRNEVDRTGLLRQ
jgi:glutaconate CoA-transferase subunit B